MSEPQPIACAADSLMTRNARISVVDPYGNVLLQHADATRRSAHAKIMLSKRVARDAHTSSPVTPNDTHTTFTNDAEDVHPFESPRFFEQRRLRLWRYHNQHTLRSVRMHRSKDRTSVTRCSHTQRGWNWQLTKVATPSASCSSITLASSSSPAT